MPDPTQTPGFFSQAGSFLKDLPSALVPGENAGRTALMIWAASKGPQALIGVSDYFNQQDMRRYKTVSDPEYQDYVAKLEEQNRATGLDPASARSQAIQEANKLYVGAKGYEPSMGKELTAVDLAPGGPSAPDRQLIDMPQLPPPDKVERMKADIADAQSKMWHAQGPEADAFRERTAFGQVGTSTAAQIADAQMKYAELLGAEHPGQEVSTKYGKSGPEYSSKPRDNFVPKFITLFDKDGTPMQVDASGLGVFKDKQMDLVFGPNGEHIGYTNKGFLPSETARQNVVGTSEGKYGKPGSGVAPTAGEGGKISNRLRPGMSPADKDAENAAVLAEIKRDQARIGRAEAATDEASSIAVRATAALDEFKKAAGVVDDNGNVNFQSKNAIWSQYEPPSYYNKVAVDLAKGGPSAPNPKIREKNFIQRRAVDAETKKYEAEQWYRAKTANVADNYMLGVYYGLEGPVATLTARIFGDTRLSDADREAFKAALPSYKDYGKVAEEKFKRLPSVVAEIAKRAQEREDTVRDRINLKSVEPLAPPDAPQTEDDSGAANAFRQAVENARKQ